MNWMHSQVLSRKVRFSFQSALENLVMPALTGVASFQRVMRERCPYPPPHREREPEKLLREA
ncbi:hypothetical protein [Streptomyces sp. NWU49]|uniref:hypothetical protein n=1 Tax=Streptomyces sp. NWU49 TaxID=2201153 RepID=UPI0011B45B75|nr:hypothetical protein [Streptomyces sp. NWU49]